MLQKADFFYHSCMALIKFLLLLLLHMIYQHVQIFWIAENTEIAFIV